MYSYTSSSVFSSILISFEVTLSLNIISVFVLFLSRPIFILSQFKSVCIYCKSSAFYVVVDISSANHRLFRFSPSMFIPFSSQSILRNMFSRAAANSLGDIVSPCLTPFVIMFNEKITSTEIKIDEKTIEEVEEYMYLQQQIALKKHYET